MSDFVVVTGADELSDPGKMVVEIDDRFVILCKVAGEFYCIDDVCTHDGGTFGEGELYEHAISCPRHGAKFDIRTGQALLMPATEPTVAHKVKVVDGQVFVMLVDQ